MIDRGMTSFGVLPVCRICGEKLNDSTMNWLIGDGGSLTSIVSSICSGCDTPIYYMDSNRAEYKLTGMPVQA